MLPDPPVLHIPSRVADKQKNKQQKKSLSCLMISSSELLQCPTVNPTARALWLVKPWFLQRSAVSSLPALTPAHLCSPTPETQTTPNSGPSVDSCHVTSLGGNPPRADGEAPGWAPASHLQLLIPAACSLRHPLPALRSSHTWLVLY